MTADPAPRTVVTGRRAIVVAAVVAAVLILVGWLRWPSSPGATVLYTGTARYTATITVADPRIGSTDITVALATRTGTPAGNATIVVQATMPLTGLATPPLPATATGSGRYDTPDVPLMMTGPWQLRLTITDPTGTSDNLLVPLTVTG